jgi:ADP-ribose pyrophosphatase
MKPERMLGSDRIYQGRILNLRVDSIELPDGREAIREVIEHPGAAGVAAFDDEGRLLLVRQYRYPVGEALLELPAGRIDEGETPEQCAARELEEETGFRAGRLVALGRVYPAAAYDCEVVHLFYADGLVESQQQLDPDECIAVEHVDFDEAVRMVLSDEIPDSKTQVGILKLRLMGGVGGPLQSSLV